MEDDIRKATEILNQCSEAMNSLNHSKAYDLLNAYNTQFTHAPLPIEFLFHYLTCVGELAIRTGRFKEGLKSIEEKLERFKDFPDLKFRLLLYAGRLESSSNRLGISPRYFSEALALAESKRNTLMIAESYAEIAHMFSLRYQGLAIYFHRKAERVFAEVNDLHNQAIQRIQRAFLCFVTFKIKPTLGNKERLIEEAKLILSDIDTSDFNTSDFNTHEKRQFQYIKGMILGDQDILQSLIDDLEPVEALPDKCRYKDAFIGICLEKSYFDKAKKMVESYFGDMERLHGDVPEVKERKIQLEQIIQEETPVMFIPYHVAPSEGDNATLFDILDHYALQDELFALDRSPIRIIFPSYAQEGLFEPIKMADGTFQLFPLGMAFNVYYRGQSQYYPDSKPSLYRKGMTDAQQFVERLKYMEFKKIIEDYPLTDFFKNDFYVKAPDGDNISIPLSIDHLALAQHYGIKTELMDLTTDKFVAAFFATTDYKDDTYYPILDCKRQKGVFYRYSIGLNEMLPNNNIMPRMRAIGLQPFSRPGEQKGMVYEMHPDENFNDIVISTDYFNHDPIVSEFIFNYTNRGEKLFPKSPLQSHANSIINSKVFSNNALTQVMEEFYPDISSETIQAYLDEEQIKISDTVDFSFSERERKECIDDWINGESDRIRLQIQPRFTYAL